MKRLAVVVLAAGQGKRMKSGLAKVLHPLLGSPLVDYPLKVAESLKPEKIVVVVGVQGDQVKDALSRRGVEFALQKEQKGTGHAVQAALPKLKGFKGDVFVLYGDSPLYRSATAKELVKVHRRKKAAVTLLTAVTDDPTGYGRIIRDGAGNVMSIVEEKDCTEEQRKIKEVNPGLYCYDIDFLRKGLPKLKNNNKQGEYYLTDLAGMAALDHKLVASSTVDDGREVHGVNSLAELARAGAILRQRISGEHALAGVTIEDPENTFIEPGVTIGKETVIEPGVRLAGETKIGPSAVIEMNCRIEDSDIAAGARIKAGSVIEESKVGKNAQVGPMAHLRPGSDIGEDCRIGNFVETKKAKIGKGSKASHLSYIGDAEIGKGVNIGCGFITCNYDGVNKFKTVIEDDVFVGSDSQTVAPVKIGKGAYIGSGSTITEDVPPGSLALTRAPLTIKEGWAKEKSDRNKKIGKKAKKSGSRK